MVTVGVVVRRRRVMMVVATMVIMVMVRTRRRRWRDVVVLRAIGRMNDMKRVVVVAVIRPAGTEHHIAQRYEHTHIAGVCLGGGAEAEAKGQCRAGKQGKGSHRRFSSIPPQHRRGASVGY